MTAFDAALTDLAERDHPLSVRQAFHLAVSRGLVPKMEVRGYRPVQRAFLRLRRDGLIPYDWVVDQSRIVMTTNVYRGLHGFVEEMRLLYRPICGNDPPITCRYGVKS
jgi:hypothetical protein